ncbi:MAG TPA: phosphomevalonate kinase [Myxococcaceae bacterium]|nr:phosphomevalonate kinase [Myxococcaceae bacterium]
MQRALSAPGKLFLSGEYAVLWGGTARVAAVSPRATALVRRRADRQIHLVLEEGRLVGDATPVGARWRGEIPASFHFAARAVDEALRAHGGEVLGFDLALSPSRSGPGGRKLGMGGSARAAVLSCEAARYALELRVDVLKLALLAHAAAQDGRGSGADVAAIFAGGIVRYRRYPLDELMAASRTHALGAAFGASPPVDLWRLPSTHLHLAYVYSRESSSTRVLIAEVERRFGRGGRAGFVAESDALGSALEDGLLRGDFTTIREATEQLEALLAGLGPLETENTRRLLALARTHGCAGKISGAGGGDGCVLFAPDGASRDAALQALAARGFLAFPVNLEAGVRGEPNPDPRLMEWLKAA